MFTWSVLLVSSTLRPMARLLMVECWIIPSLSIMKSPLNAIPYHGKTKPFKIIHIKTLPSLPKFSPSLSSQPIIISYLVWDQHTIRLWNWFGDIRDQWILQVTKTAWFPICLDPCKVGKLQKKRQCAKIISNSNLWTIWHWENTYIDTQVRHA